MMKISALRKFDGQTFRLPLELLSEPEKEEHIYIYLGKDLLSCRCVLSVDNEDLSPYHLDTVTGEQGHKVRNGHCTRP